MPEYLFLIYIDPASGPQMGTPEGDARRGEWMDYSRRLAEAGLMRAGDGLATPDVATTVRVREGQRLVTDGPFAETKEFLGGYFLIDAPDLDTALEWAAQSPHIEEGSLEVRPTMGVSGG